MEATRESTVREIDSVEDLDAALAAIAELDAQKAKADADLNMRLTEVRESFSSRYLVTLDEAENQPLDVVKADLLKSIERYCVEHRSVLMPSKKSLSLKHGKVGFEAGSEAVKELEPAAVPEGTKAKKTLLEQVASMASKALDGVKKIFTKCPLGNLVRIKVEWDKTAILKRAKANEITEEQLTKAGLAIVKSDEKFYAKAKSEG